MNFSERNGYDPKSPIQFESMDSALKNRLWNVISSHFKETDRRFQINIDEILDRFFKKRIKGEKNALGQLKVQLLGEIPDLTILESEFFNLTWNKIFDFMEFFVTLPKMFGEENVFIENCNKIFIEENSAYRFIGNVIVPITTENEINTIKDAILSPSQEVNKHITKSLKLYSDRNTPDYCNCIKEAVCAVEAMARIATKSKKALSDILSSKKLGLHPTWNEILIKLNAYRGDVSGVAHSNKEGEKNPGKEDALLTLVICSAFVNYLKQVQNN